MEEALHVLSRFGVVRVGLVFVIKTFVDFAVHRLHVLGNAAQLARRLLACGAGFARAQWFFVVGFGMQFAVAVFTFHDKARTLRPFRPSGLQTYPQVLRLSNASLP